MQIKSHFKTSVSYHQMLPGTHRARGSGHESLVEKAEHLAYLLFPGLVNSVNSRTEVTFINRCIHVVNT